ncbi:MAG TPA: hypothetical protein VMM18_06715 [Gemmatimonadaceae bacterium]|nr:hypothetical protein [Gemmatimonadaceae bacterium]
MKWLDNLLSHHRVHGVLSIRQGVRRRISAEAVTTIAVALELMRALGLPTGRALAMAPELIAGRGEHHWTPLLSVHIDLARIERELADRLAEAAEAAPPRRRGRPPGATRQP